MRASLALLALALLAASPAAAPSAFASETASVADAADDASDLDQRPLTVKQIEGFIAAHDAVAAILDKVPEEERDEPNDEVQAALDKAARSFGFKDYGDLDVVAGNIEFLVAGFDPDTKTFIGYAAVLKKKIADVESNESLRPKPKARRLRKLREELDDAPEVKFAANIPLVTKYYDKLDALLDDGDE